MRLKLWHGALAAVVGATIVSCSDSPLGPRSRPAPTTARLDEAATPLPAVRFSEIHYDNSGTDANERIEVSGPAGTDLSGWQIVLYNGNGGAAYDTKTLSGTLPATCDTRGVVVTTYPSNGIQNGSPDAMALVDAGGDVVEFLSYEGTVTAVGGPANGLTSTDIGASEDGSGSADGSIQRDGNGVWTTGDTNTFGACNDAGAPAGEAVTVLVTPPTGSAVVGGTQAFTATAYDSANVAVPGLVFTWSSSDTTVTTVSATGVATGIAVGDATITAAAPNGVKGTAALHVSVAPPPAGVRISELHYDNDGADTGEAVEVEGPAGQSVDGWKILLYNGSNGEVYDSALLSGVLPASCGARGVAAVSIAGIQNGAPDGVALVDAAGRLLEFLSYEGTLTGVEGAAAGAASVDIGVSEDGSTPVGMSLQRDSSGWYGPAAASFGACNTRQAPPQSASPIVIDELMADPLHATGGASWGEWFEVHNTGAEAVDLEGWTIASGGQSAHTIATSVVVPAGGYAVLGRGYDVARNGGITLDYNYFDGDATMWLDDTDYLVLRDGAGALVDSVRWKSRSTIVKGATRALKDASTADADVDGSGWGYSTVPFGDGDLGTPHAANGTLSDTPPAVPNVVSFSGRDASDPPLPVGFEDQIFATLRDGSGNAVPTTFTWTAETPQVATIDAEGVVHALAAGTAVFRATATDGTTATYSLATTVATLSTTAHYAGNTEFGVPTDGDASDDQIVARLEYTTSYNPHRGSPNWVSYDLDASQFGSEDRCDCFTFDPELPSGDTHLTTADYTGAGTAAGYGIDRGHLARSADRTSGTLDNATTFYLSNIIPQASDLNQGPWANMENSLGDLARGGDEEVYIVAGVAGSKGTVKDEGKITIPAQVWKVAVIVPRDSGLASVHGVDDLRVIAVVMPNEPGVRDVDWRTYQTTVDSVEALSGYDLLSKLPDDVEWLVEAGITAPENATATQLLGILSTGVRTLVDGGVLSAGEGDALAASLSAAGASLAGGNGQAASGQLGAFRNKVEAMVRSGRLSAEEGESLTALAGRVLDRLD